MGKKYSFDKDRIKVLLLEGIHKSATEFFNCLLYTSEAADDLLCVDLGGRRINKKKKKKTNTIPTLSNS